MITVANRIYVKQEYADAFDKRFQERAGLVDKMPGFISNQVLRPVNEGDPYVVFTIWNSRQDFLHWVRSDEFVKGHAQSGTLPRTRFLRQTFWRCMKSSRIRPGPTWNQSHAGVHSRCTEMECADLSVLSSVGTCRDHCKLDH